MKIKRNPIKKRRRKRQRGGDLQTKASKFLPKLPWAKYKGEKHLPKYNYCGPNTALDIRLDKNNKPKSGEEPVNAIDAACLKHDLAYKSENIKDRHLADINLIHDLNSFKNLKLTEKMAKALIKIAMKSKVFIGQ